MPEIANRKYIPIADNHRVFVEEIVPSASLALAVAHYSEPVDFTGFSRQAFKVVLDDRGGVATAAQITFQLQERHDGQWVDKKGLIPATVSIGEVCEHNSEDIMREARICITPLTALPNTGVFIQISGKRDL